MEWYNKEKCTEEIIHDDHAGFLNELLGRNKDFKVIMSNKAMEILKRGQISFEGGCSTFPAWVFCKFMRMLGKEKHLFPAIEDKYDDRFIKITEANKTVLEDLLQGKILYTPGHTSDSISLRIDNIIFCGDATMNAFKSMKRRSIWIENKEEFGKSWDVLFSEDVDWIYPAHGKPFPKSDIKKFQKEISKMKIYNIT